MSETCKRCGRDDCDEVDEAYWERLRGYIASLPPQHFDDDCDDLPEPIV